VVAEKDFRYIPSAEGESNCGEGIFVVSLP